MNPCLMTTLNSSKFWTPPLRLVPNNRGERTVNSWCKLPLPGACMHEIRSQANNWALSAHPPAPAQQVQLQLLVDSAHASRRLVGTQGVPRGVQGALCHHIYLACPGRCFCKKSLGSRADHLTVLCVYLMKDNTSFALEVALEEMPSFYKERAASNIDNYLDSSGRVQLIVEHIPQVDRFCCWLFQFQHV